MFRICQIAIKLWLPLLKVNAISSRSDVKLTGYSKVGPKRNSISVQQVHGATLFHMICAWILHKFYKQRKSHTKYIVHFLKKTPIYSYTAVGVERTRTNYFLNSLTRCLHVTLADSCDIFYGIHSYRNRALPITSI